MVSYELLISQPGRPPGRGLAGRQVGGLVGQRVGMQAGRWAGGRFILFHIINGKPNVFPETLHINLCKTHFNVHTS